MKRLWNNKLIIKLFLSYLVVVLLLSASFYLYSTPALRKFYIANLSERMKRDAHLLGRLLPRDQQGLRFDALCRKFGDDLGLRITVIAADGMVLCDSTEGSAGMENHAGRPEVAAALQRNSGSATRYSTTVQLDMFYYALKQAASGQERVIRIAKPLTEIESAIHTNRLSVLSGLLVAAALGLLLAWAFSRHLTRRFQRLERFAAQVAEGSFPENFFASPSGDEISLLEQRLNHMGQKIRDHLQHIRTEKEKVDSILRCMIEGVLVLDPKGQVLVINDEARRMFEVPEGRDIHGASVLDISRHPEMHKILEDVLAFDFSEHRYSKEVELYDGRWFRVNAVCLRNPQNHPLGSILVFHDITGIKILEHMRADFVANVSHELRTPLTAIRGYVETLLHTPPSEPQERRHFLTIIDRHSERLSRLTSDLLTLSDLESGKVRLTLQPLDVNQLLQRIMEVFSDRAAKEDVTLRYQTTGDLPKLLGDADRLQQLFINLADNAIKYTPAGGHVTLTAAGLSPEDSARRMIEIAVADTGPGIPAKDLPRLTERFYRVDKARSRELGGTGLGLAIVKHIVHAHDGELVIESVIAKGTTVRVRLPVAASDMHTRRGILFLCTGNSCRSQMAEGFARALAPRGTRIFSAGTEPKTLHPIAIQVMRESGIDTSPQYAKGVEDVPMDAVDLIVTLCGEAAEACPSLGIKAEHIHWPIPDPAQYKGDENAILQFFRQVRDDIRGRVASLLAPS